MEAEENSGQWKESKAWPYEGTTEERNSTEARLIARYAERFVGRPVARKYNPASQTQLPVVLVEIRPSGFLHLAVKRGRELTDHWAGPPNIVMTVGVSFYRMTSGDPLGAPPAWAVVEENNAVHFAVCRGQVVPGLPGRCEPGPVLFEGGTIIRPGSPMPVFPSSIGVVPTPAMMDAYRAAHPRAHVQHSVPAPRVAPKPVPPAPAPLKPATAVLSPTLVPVVTPAAPDPEPAEPDPVPQIKANPNLPRRSGPAFGFRRP